MPVRPNILLILVDSAQAAIYRANGGLCQTPHADRLAAEGARFTTAFTASPICHPARAAIDTGLFPHKNGMLANSALGGGHPFQVFDHVPSIAQRLSAAGYRCGYAGQGHIARRGFHDDRSFPTAQYRDWLKKQGFEEKPMPAHSFKGCGRLPFGLEQSRDAPFASAAVQLVEEYSRSSEPWFIQCDFDGPHPPCFVPAPYDKLYRPEHLPLPVNLRDDLSDKPAVHRRFQERQGTMAWSEHDWRVLLGHYYGFVTMLDELLGRILEKLDVLGLSEQTAVVFCSDHGGMLGAHGLLYHGTPLLFDEVMRVPLFIRYPEKFPQGNVRNELVASVDLLPTFLDLAGIPSDPSLHGRSLVPLLSGNSVSDRRDCVGAEYHGDGVSFYSVRMARTHDWKYVYHPNSEGELYDLKDDPAELHNRFADPQAADALALMRTRLLRWMTQVEDPLRRNADWRDMASK